MKTNPTTGVPAAPRAKIIVNVPFIQSLKEEINILQDCTQDHGTDISNMLEMLNEQLSTAFDKAEKLPENEKDDILKTLCYMDTLLRTVRSKINNQLFWAIDNVVNKIESEDAA